MIGGAAIEAGAGMRVLVIGSGGREHALCWALSGSPLLTQLWCAPGNPGIAECATCVPIGADDIAALVRFAHDNAVDLVVPGPEAPLVEGVADAMDEAGIACCGPSAAAARLEGSKAFANEVCDAAGVPTPKWECFDDIEAARAFVSRRGAPIVIKADGLAAGKGVVVAQTEEAAFAALEAMMRAGSLGEVGRAVVIEECLTGEELSFFALCDGEHAIPLGSARDYKRVGEGDVGPNTGGMGAVSPAPGMTPEHEEALMGGVVRPVLAEMARRGCPFRGVLFAGLMRTTGGVVVIEFNVRFGDPECQVLMPRLRSDLLPALQAVCDGELGDFDLRWEDRTAVGVVLAARGYPEAPRKGGAIGGLDRATAIPGVRVFHAGTARDEKVGLVATGGRVLTVCATAVSVAEARRSAYAGVGAIEFPDGFCRGDIGLGAA